MNLFINIVKHWAKTCWFLVKNVRHCCQSCILRVEENFWLQIKWFTKVSLLILFSGLWVEIFWAFGEKVWGAFFKKAFSMSREKIRRKLLCWRPFFSKDLKFWAKFFSYLRKNFRSVINTAFYMSRGAFSDFWKFNFFPVSGLKRFGFLSRTFSAWLPKRYSTCLGKLFEENELVRKKNVFVFFFAVWAEVFRIFGAIFRGMDFKSAFCMSKVKFRGEVFVELHYLLKLLSFFLNFFRVSVEKT